MRRMRLMNTNASDFTVQEVVERSGQSLRTFYQYFAGSTSCCSRCSKSRSRVRPPVSRSRGAARRPLDRSKVLRGVLPHVPGERARRTSDGTAPALVEFAQQLLTSHPKEAAHSFAPIVELFGRLLEEAEVAGTLRPGLDRQRIAGVVLQATMFNAFAATISASPVGTGGEVLWDLLVHGVAADDATVNRLTRTGPG